MKITKDTLIGELIREDFRYAHILMLNGMGCVGCPASQMETLEQASMVHNLDLDDILEQLHQLEAENEREAATN